MRKTYIVLIAALTAIACLRIVATHSAFVQTYDEPAHIACGMEWLDKGTYHYEFQHPPLTRIMAALGPYLAGSRSHGEKSMWDEGNAILYTGNYMANLERARLGNLLFFILAVVAVAWMAWTLYGPPVALASVFVFTMMPAVLGHAGVATTDMGITAFFAPAIIMFAYWLSKPSVINSVLFALLVAVSVFSKYSAIFFLGIGGIIVLCVFFLKERGSAVGRILQSLKKIPIVLFVFLFVGWACFRFSLQPLLEGHGQQWIDLFSAKLHVSKETVEYLGSLPVPLSELVRGIVAVAMHNVGGHVAYLLGKTSHYGWWYYYPVVLGVKLPLSLLATYLVGLVFLFRDKVRDDFWPGLLPTLFPAGVVAGCILISNINIGVRHILPIFPFMALTAGYGFVRLIKMSRVLAAAGIALALVLAATSFMAHPLYISYFNAVAGDAPYRYLIKSDLDWSQYVGDLAGYLKDHDIPEVSIAYTGTADLSRHGLPPYVDITHEIPEKAEGWFAIDAIPRFTDPGFAWLDRYRPVAVVRNSFFIYHFEKPVSTAAP
jgi:4-amino-4-deoxy-L-arabinose transferase-like glycosyltransferase